MPESSSPADTFIQLIDEHARIGTEPWDADTVQAVFSRNREFARRASDQNAATNAANDKRREAIRARLREIVPDLLALSHAAGVGNAAAVTRYIQTWKHSDAVEAKGVAMQLAAAPALLPDATKNAVKSKRARKDEANIMARQYLKDSPNATARELQARIGCSIGLVSKLPAWEAVQEQKSKGREPKKAKVVSLTAKLQRTAGDEDKSLAKLIDEQDADAEPSPMQDDPRRDGSPRRAKVYRKP